MVPLLGQSDPGRQMAGSSPPRPAIWRAIWPFRSMHRDCYSNSRTASPRSDLRCPRPRKHSPTLTLGLIVSAAVSSASNVPSGIDEEVGRAIVANLAWGAAREALGRANALAELRPSELSRARLDAERALVGRTREVFNNALAAMGGVGPFLADEGRGAYQKNISLVRSEIAWISS